MLATPLALDESLFHPPPFPLNPAPLILIPYLPPSIFLQLSSPQSTDPFSTLVEPSATPLALAYERSYESVLLRRVSRSDITMDACVSEGGRGRGVMWRKYARMDEQPPMLERSWKEEEGGRFLPRSCSILLEHIWPRRRMSPRYIRWNE